MVSPEKSNTSKSGRPPHRFWDDNYERALQNGKKGAKCLICNKFLSGHSSSDLKRHRLVYLFIFYIKSCLTVIIALDF